MIVAKPPRPQAAGPALTVILALALSALGGVGWAGPEPYPDEAFSSPWVDRWDAFETVSGVQPAGNPVQRLAQWEANELRAVVRDDEPWTRWRFICRPGNGAVLCFHERIRRMPSAVTVRAANQGSQPVRFAVSMSEIPWTHDPPPDCRNWAVNGDAPVAPGEERVARFDLAQLQPDKPGPSTTPAWPTTINLHVAGPEAGVEYTLDLRDWAVLYPPAAGVRVDRLDAPKTLRPGAEARFVLETHGVRVGARVDLEVRDGPRVLWRLRLSAEEAEALAEAGRLTVRRETPWYLPTRRLTAGLVVDGYRAAGAEAEVQVRNPTRPEFPHAERRVSGGRPTLFVDDRPVTWSGYSSYEYQPGNVSEFGASGVNVFVVPVAAGRHVHQISATTWVAPDRYDFSQVDERVCMALQANPRAYLVLRVSLALPVFWLQEHPDSIARVRPADGNGPGSVVWEETGCLAASLASSEWQAQQETCLRALIAHCAAQPWARRVVGFQPTGEVTEEWFAWGCNDGYYADYSPATESGFAAWCDRQGYPWSAVPLPQARQRPGWDYYPADDAGQHAAVYAQYQNELTAEVVVRFARVIKEATGGRSLVGAFHSYLVQLAGEPRQHLAGQFAMRRLLDCPDFDFFAGVPLLNFRDLTQGYDAYGSATESILAAGKLLVNENDLFSWLHHLLWYTPYDPADPRAGAISMHRRVLADDMVHGAQRGWFSLLASWHHDAGLQAEFARQIALQATGLQYDRTGAEQVALVVDDSSFNWIPPETKLPAATHPGLLYALGRSGAPVGVWLLRDLDRLPSRVKLVVVAEATAALPEDTRKLEALLQEGGRTVVVVGAPGLIDPGTMEWRPGVPGALLGLPLEVDEQGGAGIATLEGTGQQVCGLAQVRPRTTGQGDGWMRFLDGSAAGLERGLPNGGRLIWCAVPPQLGALTRAWMERAGVHCYAPLEYSVHASQGLVAITAPSAGEAELHWPTPVKVRDLLDGWSAEGADFACPFAGGQTRLFAVRAR